MQDKDSLCHILETRKEYKDLYNYITKSTNESVKFQIIVRNYNCEIFDIFNNYLFVNKDVLIGILEELIKHQDEEFERIIKQDEVEVI